MLTHLVKSREMALFLIDEPDIYLHADLQRQLLDLLRNLGPDILIATHSTEIITEAEVDDIVLINKKRKSARRIKHPSELAEVFAILGSNLNPVLTQLAKSRRALFVEGKDFQILGKFARKLNYAKVANRNEFAVIPVEGFNPERIRSLKKGIETTLGGKIAAAAILDRDYRSQAECEEISRACGDFCDLVRIHDCKEVENFLLSPPAIDRAAARRVADRTKRGRHEQSFAPCARTLLDDFADGRKTYVTSQYLAFRRRFQSELV
jgi:predicted ATP-dependent endonuclease of OLD family